MTHSRLPGFHNLSLVQRRTLIKAGLTSPLDDFETVLDSGGIDSSGADKIVENALGLYALPLGICLNLTINGKDRLAPMAVEEPSVVAAASHAAKMVRSGGGFQASVEEQLLAAQIELRHVPDAETCQRAIEAEKGSLLDLANLALPGLVRRGGGARELEMRWIGPGHLVVHVLIDCLDAMGANLANTAAEALGAKLAELTHAQLGLRILSNLADRRLVQVRAQVPLAALVGSLAQTSGETIADAIAAASLFAERDPYRAATHNKGIMNGIDSVVIATGNDYRAVEAGAHAYAARTGRYGPLATWRRNGHILEGQLEMPLALGMVGGTIRVHRGARLALAVAEIQSAADLAMVAGSVGLASNLAALRALATEGIQRGHMSLHTRAVAAATGATDAGAGADGRQRLE